MSLKVNQIKKNKEEEKEAKTSEKHKSGKAAAKQNNRSELQFAKVA